jgi:CRISPR-associated protein Cas5d
MKDIKTVKIKVWGDWACFTRPDLKVERMTYPCMTPSAARGLLEAILYKPEFVWHIRSIYIIKPVMFFSIRRNEINKKATNDPIVIDEVDKDGKPKNRVMRNSIILRDVEYIIEADIVVPEPNEKNHSTKYMAMFNRRVEKGQCYKRPYFGTREFAAEFGPSPKDFSPIQEDIPIGGMLLDIFYDPSGKPQPKFFEAAVRNGILNCYEEYKEMLASSHLKPTDEINEVFHNWNSTEELELAAEGLL